MSSKFVIVRTPTVQILRYPLTYPKRRFPLVPPRTDWQEVDPPKKRVFASVEEEARVIELERIACGMRACGMSLEEISFVTDLSFETIENL